MKPSGNMGLMRSDMSGGAAVLASILGISALDIPINVTALIPLCENMPAGNALKPGDVLTSMSGKTVEVHRQYSTLLIEQFRLITRMLKAGLSCVMHFIMLTVFNPTLL